MQKMNNEEYQATLHKENNTELNLDELKKMESTTKTAKNKIEQNITVDATFNSFDHFCMKFFVYI